MPAARHMYARGLDPLIFTSAGRVEKHTTYLGVEGALRAGAMGRRRHLMQVPVAKALTIRSKQHRRVGSPACQVRGHDEVTAVFWLEDSWRLCLQLRESHLHCIALHCMNLQHWVQDKNTLSLRLVTAPDWKMHRCRLCL